MRTLNLVIGGDGYWRVKTRAFENRQSSPAGAICERAFVLLLSTKSEVFVNRDFIVGTLRRDSSAQAGRLERFRKLISKPKRASSTRRSWVSTALEICTAADTQRSLCVEIHKLSSPLREQRTTFLEIARDAAGFVRSLEARSTTASSGGCECKS